MGVRLADQDQNMYRTYYHIALNINYWFGQPIGLPQDYVEVCIVVEKHFGNVVASFFEMQAVYEATTLLSFTNQ